MSDEPSPPPDPGWYVEMPNGGRTLPVFDDDDPRWGLSGPSKPKKDDTPPMWALAPIIVLFTLVSMITVVALIGVFARVWEWTFL